MEPDGVFSYTCGTDHWEGTLVTNDERFSRLGGVSEPGNTTGTAETDFSYGDVWRSVYCEILMEVSPDWSRVTEGAQGRFEAGRLKIVRARGQALPACASWTRVSRWSLLYQGKWAREEHNNILELRTIIALLRHLSRSRPCWGKRVLVFSDSLVSMGVLAKGRSSASGLLHLARQAAAIVLVCGIKLHLRWVASEDNVADGPSRGLTIGAAETTKDEHKWRHTPKLLRARLGLFRSECQT